MTEAPFQPAPGQVDFTHARWAPVINCVVRRRERILLLHRSEHVGFYRGLWNGLAGFLDDHQSLEEKVRSELKEELGFVGDVISKITFGPVFDADDPQLGKTWIVHPALVDVTDDAEPVLDWEAHEHVWVTPEEALSYDLIPSFRQVLASVLGQEASSRAGGVLRPAKPSPMVGELRG